MEIVVVEPSGQSAAALSGGRVGAFVGPFAQHGLDEAFGFSVGARSIGASEDLADGEAFAESAPGEGFKDFAVIGEKASGIYAAGLIPVDGSLKEGSGVFLVFSAQRLNVAQA